MQTSKESVHISCTPQQTILLSQFYGTFVDSYMITLWRSLCSTSASCSLFSSSSFSNASSCCLRQSSSFVLPLRKTDLTDFTNWTHVKSTDGKIIHYDDDYANSKSVVCLESKPCNPNKPAKTNNTLKTFNSLYSTVTFKKHLKRKRFIQMGFLWQLK